MVFSRTGQRQTKAMRKTFIVVPTPRTNSPKGSNAGGGIARKNSTSGPAASLARLENPSNKPTTTATMTAKL
jgi:hypothetical protein